MISTFLTLYFSIMLVCALILIAIAGIMFLFYLFEDRRD